MSTAMTLTTAQRDSYEASLDRAAALILEVRETMVGIGKNHEGFRELGLAFRCIQDVRESLNNSRLACYQERDAQRDRAAGEETP